jgi:hypothetical protein
MVVSTVMASLPWMIYMPSAVVFPAFEANWTASAVPGILKEVAGKEPS